MTSYITYNVWKYESFYPSSLDPLDPLTRCFSVFYFSDFSWIFPLISVRFGNRYGTVYFHFPFIAIDACCFCSLFFIFEDLYDIFLESWNLLETRRLKLLSWVRWLMIIIVYSLFSLHKLLSTFYFSIFIDFISSSSFQIIYNYFSWKGNVLFS